MSWRGIRGARGGWVNRFGRSFVQACPCSQRCADVYIALNAAPARYCRLFRNVAQEKRCSRVRQPRKWCGGDSAPVRGQARSRVCYGCGPSSERTESLIVLQSKGAQDGAMSFLEASLFRESRVWVGSDDRLNREIGKPTVPEAPTKTST
ncbi:hypothetical protein BJX68DRAFT_89061 [Aspergillus pseudodeflectus]|uniref:Uncharacterized protein n=1 Tax=Aspergillus pseudodeflectus TaxID=176178 RepID=A0ABR4L8B4_9EURO